jgi:hypothetical protein
MDSEKTGYNVKTTLTTILPIIIAIFGILIGYTYRIPYSSDLNWQIILGRVVLQQHALPTILGNATFSSPNSTWLPHEWIFSVIYALTSDNNIKVVFCLMCALLALATIIINIVRAKTASPTTNLIALAFLMIAILPAFGLRAQVLGWPLLAVAMLVLESNPRRHWLLIPIAIIWDNLHASGLILPAIILVYGCGRILTEKTKNALLSTILLTLGTFCASIITPFGLTYATFAASWSTNPFATNFINEWLPLSLKNLTIGEFAILGVLIAGEIFGSRLTWSQRLLTVALFVSAALHVRNVPLFCIVTSPWVAITLNRILHHQPENNTKVTKHAIPIIAGIIAAITLEIGSTKIPMGIQKNPNLAVTYIVELDRPMRVMCEEWNWCNLFPDTNKIQVYMDGRIDAYPNTVLTDYGHMSDGHGSEALARWNINAVIAIHDSKLAQSLKEPTWHHIPSGSTDLFIKDVPSINIPTARTKKEATAKHEQV